MEIYPSHTYIHTYLLTHIHRYMHTYIHITFPLALTRNHTHTHSTVTTQSPHSRHTVATQSLHNTHGWLHQDQTAGGSRAVFTLNATQRTLNRHPTGAQRALNGHSTDTQRTHSTPPHLVLLGGQGRFRNKFN